ncbi:MAG: hypothetical protein ABII90_00845, partial [Bacteroidota bacterium]
MIKKLISILFFSLLFLFPIGTYATHLVGGNLAYEYLGETFPGSGMYRYKITFRTYIDCNSEFWGAGFPETNFNIGIYEGTAIPSGNLPRETVLNMPLTDSTYIQLNLPDTCAVGSTVCIYEVVYVEEVDLPLSFVGYHLYYNRCCRNYDIVNLFDAGAQGMVFHAYIPPSLVENSSPVFSDLPVPFLCEDDTNSLINTAFDADGDMLIFSFIHPFDGEASGVDPAPFPPDPLNWPPPLVVYESGYNKNQPFGSGGYVYINASTGYTEYMSPDTGRFVVAVEIKEYRNSQLIGITRRDLQLQIIECPYNPPPNLSPIGGSGQTVYSIDEGDSLCFPITFTDQFGDSIILEANAPIFDSSLTNPPATINSPVGGDSIVTTQFCWNTACGQGQPLPYLFTVSVRDDGCPPKIANEVYEITVSPFDGPSAIVGINSICPFGSGLSYDVPNISGATYSWVITGGTQVSGGNTNSIIVDWGSAGTGNVAVTTTSFLGCSVGPVDLAVTINPYPNGDAGPDVYLCSGDTAQLGAALTIGYTYLWSPSTALSDSTAPNPSITLTNTSASPDTSVYIVTTTSLTTNCVIDDTVQVIVYPLPIPDAGADVVFCSGESVMLGTTPSTGYAYSWSPGTGLNDSTLSNPTISLTNLGSVPDTFEYIVTTTDTMPSCISSDTVQVVVSPNAVSDAGPDVSFCSGETDSIGADTTIGYTYLWAPTTGLSDPTASNTAITLVNSDTITDTLMYYVTTTLDSCSTVDSVQVFVYALPIVDAGEDKYLCSGDVDTIGSAPIGGYIYLWTPGTGLSDITIANPEISLTNPFILNDTIEYIVTVTTGFGCVDADTVMVVVNHLPVSGAGADISFCSGETDSIGTTSTLGYTYLWTPTTGLSDPAISNPTITLVNSDTITDTLMYYVTTTVDSCSTVDSVQVIVYASPIVDAGEDKYLCSGGVDTIGSEPIGGYTYLWTPGTGLLDSTVANPEVSLTNLFILNDTIEYIVTVTTGFSCVDADTVMVIVNHLPVSDAGIDNSFCSGETDSIGTTSTPGYTYLWLPPTGLSDPAISNPVITLVNSDTITDTLMYYVTTTVDSCSTVDSVQVIVFPSPNADAGADVIFCTGDTVQLGTVTTTDYTYLWSPVTGLSDTTISDPTVTLVNLDTISYTFEYVVTTTDTNSCKSNDTVLVIVIPYPNTPDIFGSISVCPGVDSVSYWVDDTTGSTYQWFLTGDGIIISGQGTDSILINWGASGTGTVSVVETDSIACIGDTSGLDVVSNVILAPPEPSGPDTVCDRYLTGVEYQVFYTNGSIYTWFITGGTIISGDGTNSIIVDWDSIGTGMLWYLEDNTTTTDTCAGVSDTLYVSIFQSPTASSIAGTYTFCEGTDSFAYSILGLPGSSFTWLVDDDTVASGVGLDTIFLIWDSAGVYELSVVETTDSGCTEILTDTVTVYPTPKISSIFGDTSICFDSADVYLYYVDGFSGSVYQWSVTGGTITTDSAQLANDSITIRWDSVVVGNITVVEISQDSCIGDTIGLTVFVNEVPGADSINGDFILCEDSIPISYSISGLPGSWFTWLLDSDTVASGIDIDSISLICDSAGIYELVVIEVTPNSCSVTLSDTVIVYQTPQTSSINGDTAICYDSLGEYLYYVTGLAGSSYQWNVTGGTITSSPITNDSITVLWDSVVVGNITLIEISQDSCIGDTIALTVFVNEVPGAVSINGDFILCEDSI